ncbi:hypothetical protein BS17DRAFT_554150 [Gyrodon lividus]|nr:hypothetical protein BS17DRAFT_554150 [Gyrodon lividus]
MPASRIHGRYSIPRRPSGFASLTSDLIKPGVYGAPSPSPRSVTFAPNVTPGTFSEFDDLSLSTSPEPSLPPNEQLFPPSELPPNPSSRRRVPPGKRRSLGYIPRPPNAFMLFRADFVRQKHVPGSIETNHGSLSKIIGNCWRSLPLDEKRIWEIRAKQEKDAHSKRYPGYRFRPVHNKSKDKKKDKPCTTPEDERRCEEVAQLLLEGKKGDALAAAIRRLDEQKAAVPLPVMAPAPVQAPSSHARMQPYPSRRPSSVPLPDSRFHGIALPSVPFFAPASRSRSPVGNISRNARMIIGQRRPSSALPHVGRSSWGMDNIPMFPPMPADIYGYYSSSTSSLQRDDSPLPEVDTSLFDPSFLDANFGFQLGTGEPAINFTDIFSPLAPHAPSPPVSYNLAPLDHISPQDLSLSLGCSPASQFNVSHSNITTATSWGTRTPIGCSNSQPSSTYSGSPARSELGLPVVAPRPQHASGSSAFDMWQDMSMSTLMHGVGAATGPQGKGAPGQVQGLSGALAPQHMSGAAVADMDSQQMNMAEFETLLDGSFAGLPMHGLPLAEFAF